MATHVYMGQHVNRKNAIARGRQPANTTQLLGTLDDDGWADEVKHFQN